MPGNEAIHLIVMEHLLCHHPLYIAALTLQAVFVDQNVPIELAVRHALAICCEPSLVVLRYILREKAKSPVTLPI